MQRFLLTASMPLLVLTLLACNHNPTQVAAASTSPDPATPPAAQDSSGRSLQIRVSSTHRTYACQGDGVDSVQVTGSSDILTITGHCGSLQVTGNSNSITIDSVQSIQFTGASNSVLYRNSTTPSISDTGQSNSAAHINGQITTSRNNTVTSNNSTVTSTDQNGSTTVVGGALGTAVSSALQAANGAAATAGAVQGIQKQGNDLTIQLSNQRTTQDCGDGKTVSINGYQNDITLTGSCGQVTLNGWGNTVHIEEAASIQVVGHTNTITWQRGRNVRKPSVQITGGMDNSVRHVTQASE